MRVLMQAFPAMKESGRNQLTFCEDALSSFEVLRFVADRRIGLLKLERVEPDLESLFLEVTQK